MKVVLIIALFIFGIKTVGFSQDKERFVLRGTIEGLKDQTTLYLLTKEKDTIASAKSNNQQFNFEGHVEGDANYYFILLDSNVNKKFSNALWLVNSALTATGRLVDWPKLELTGSEAHDEYIALRQLHSAVKSTPQEFDELKKFARSHSNSLYISELILRLASLYKPREIDSLLQNMSHRARNSYYGKILEKEVNNIKLAEDLKKRVQDSTYVPNFHFSTINGKKATLFEMLSQNEYTLIDFWASWCSPCKEDIPYIKETYNSFSRKGFGVLSISIDENPENWKRSIEKDSIPWSHGIDDIQKASKNIFSLTGIPAYFLVNKKGKIIKSEFFSTKKPSIARDRFSIRKDLYQIVSSLLDSKVETKNKLTTSGI